MSSAARRTGPDTARRYDVSRLPMRVIRVVAATALATATLLALPSGAGAATSPGCSAQAGTSCTFVPDTATPNASGYISATPGDYNVTTVNTVALGAPNPCDIVKSAASDPGTAATTSVSTTTSTTYTTTFSNTGPGIGGLKFTVGCSYTVNVGGTTGNAGYVIGGATD